MDEATQAVRGLLEGRPSKTAVAHLLRGCASCRRELARAVGPSPHPSLRRVVSALTDRLEAAQARAEVEKELAPALVDRLLRHPRGRRLTVVKNSWQVQSPPVVDLLVARSRALLGQDLAEAVHLAELAKEAADRLSTEDYGEGLALDLQGRARVGLALALRKSSRYREAQATLGDAEGLFERGSRDWVDLGGLHEERGELYSRMKRTEDALRCLRQAARIFLARGDYRAVGRVLQRLARAWSEVDEPAREGKALSGALQLADAEADGRLALAVAHNLLESLLETDQRERALSLIRVTLPVYELFATPTDRVIVRWTEARILASHKKPTEAVRAFRNARDGFLHMGMPVEAALCSLDEALVHLAVGRLDQVKIISTQILPTLDSRQLAREALAALALFVRAAHDEVATAQMVRAVARAIRIRTPRQKT